ncbi:MAG TPA: TVP38/TMEM64 family protein [Thermoanaerobaculia bacterium]
MSERRSTYIRIAAALLVVVAIVVLVRTLPVAEWLESVKAYVRGAGAMGYVIYALVYALCCVFFIPASVLTLGAGAIFGVVRGTIVVLFGATLGATLAFLLARTVMRRKIEAMTAGNAKLAAVDRAIEAEGTKIMFLMRLSGFPPFTWINYALGLTGVKLGAYVLTTFIGIIPGCAAFAYAGAAGAAAVSGSGNRIGLIAAAVGATIVSVVVARIATKAIRRAGVEGNG